MSASKQRPDERSREQTTMPGRMPSHADVNHGNQCNPNNKNYQGYDRNFGGQTEADRNNHANQLNPRHNK